MFLKFLFWWKYKNWYKQKVAQNVAISLGYFIFTKMTVNFKSNQMRGNQLPDLITSMGTRYVLKLLFSEESENC